MYCAEVGSKFSKGGRQERARMARRREWMAGESSLHNNNHDNITYEPGQRALGTGMVPLSLGNQNEVIPCTGGG